jgi:hypothetical protein
LFVLFRTPATSHYPLLAVVLLGVGFGSTSLLFGATVAGSTGVRNEDQGLAGALVNTTRQIGSAIGVAVLLSIVASDSVTRSTGGLAAGYRTALLWTTAFAVVAAFASLAAPTSGPRGRGGETRVARALNGDVSARLAGR